MIEEISVKYDLDVQEMKAKYLTPTFYDLMFPTNNIYNVVFEEPKVKPLKLNPRIKSVITK